MMHLFPLGEHVPLKQHLFSLVARVTYMHLMDSMSDLLLSVNKQNYRLMFDKELFVYNTQL